MNFYTISGLAVLSDVLLPGASLRTPDGAPADIVIRQSEVPYELTDASARSATWQMAGGLFLMRFPGLARFVMREGREIVFATEGATQPEEIAIFLLGTLFGILLHQRGSIVLHASAIDIGGRAVLFCGPSGSGKSTMAAALVRRGYPLLIDDVCAIHFDTARWPHATSDGRKMKLWTDAIAGLALEESRGDAVRRELMKYYVEPAQAVSGSLPLAAIYVLREAKPPWESGIRKPNLVDRSLLLRRSAYRSRIVTLLGQQGDYFRAASAIAGTAGVFHLTREFDFAQLPEVVGWLEDHWARRGPGAKAA